MGRTKGATNRQVNTPTYYTLSLAERAQLIAALLVEIISEELCTKD
ncbi:MAG TPA: hypothetical protein VMB52_00425 [Verrucomicrobiae bacterium]|nr:hypothetical protein [Verrucomicrobiae bacterium]